jgi:hypothetical protein
MRSSLVADGTASQGVARIPPALSAANDSSN